MGSLETVSQTFTVQLAMFDCPKYQLILGMDILVPLAAHAYIGDRVLELKDANGQLFKLKLVPKSEV